MNRTGAAILLVLIAGVGLLLAPLATGRTTTTAAAGAPGEAWFGAVLGNGSLLPFAVWTSDGWHRWPSFDPREPAPQTLAELPATWLPAGRRPPAEWDGSLFDDRRVVIRTQPTVKTSQFLQTLVLDTDVPVVTATPGAGGAPADLGLAVSGAALELFRSVPMDQLTDVMRFADAAMVDAERASLPPETLHQISDDMWAGTPTEIETAVAASGADGGREFYVEGMKTFEAAEGECKPLVRVAIAVEERRGQRRMIDVKAQALDTCGHYVAHMPLAVAQRGAARCWVVQRVYEDGLDYTLTEPGHGSSDAPAIGCDLGRQAGSTP
jgi:hypothetical protein